MAGGFLADAAMRVLHGDLIKLALGGEFDVIVHGCNCHCAMYSGVAKGIRDAFPEAHEADNQTRSGDEQKLGHYSKAHIEPGSTRFTVVNAYTQFHRRGEGVLADYAAIRSVMAAIKRDFQGLRIGYPRIGAGLAGGDWAVTSQIIDEELNGEDHTLVEYQPE